MKHSHESRRRHSISSEDEFARPVRGRPYERQQGSRRVRVPRSKSASNMLELFNNTASNTANNASSNTPSNTVNNTVNNTVPISLEEQLRNGVREQVDRQATQELGEFLKSTGPRASSHRFDDCFRVPGIGNGPKRFSFGSLLSRRSKNEKQKPSESTKPGTIEKESRFTAVTVPKRESVSGPPSRSPFPEFAAELSASPMGGPRSPLWPARVSSRGALSPTSTSGPDYSSPLETPKAPASEFDFLQHPINSAAFAELNKTLQQHLFSNADSSSQNEGLDSASTPDSNMDTGIISIRPRRDSPARSSTGHARITIQDGIPVVNTDSATPTEGPNENASSDIVNFSIRSAVTPPCMAQSEKPGFPEVRIEGPESPTISLTAVPEAGGTTSLPSSPPGSPTSPRKTRPANITVGSTLQVPKESPLPESPGFPTMLAAMTFPSPPKTSPCHTPSGSTISDVPRPKTSPASGPPIIRPRLSSLGARNSQTLSLDQVVMQNGRKSASPTPAESTLSTTDAVPTTPTFLVNSEVATNVTAADSNLDTTPTKDNFMELPHDGNSERPHSASSASTTKPQHRDSSGSLSSSFYTADESHRTSIASSGFESEERSRHSGSTEDLSHIRDLRGDSNRQSASTNNSCRQSGITDESYRQSTRSDMTAATDLTVPMDEGVYKNQLCAGESINPPEHRESGDRKESAGSIESGNNVSDTTTSERPDTPSTPYSPATDEDLHSGSILERRIARKAMVQEYKQRDLSIVQTPPHLSPLIGGDTVDSPVLGWFTQNSTKSKQISLKQLSPLSNVGYSAIPTAETTPITPTQPCHLQVPDTPRLHEPPKQDDKNPVSDTPNSTNWSFSPLMVVESTPDDMAAQQDNQEKVAEPVKLTISPIIIIADVSGPPSPKQTKTLRPLSLLQAEPPVIPILPPRSALRPKIKSQRPLPIKVARLSISAIPEDGPQPSARHTISSMPTPPGSPETQHSNRVVSFPAQVLQQALPTPPEIQVSEAAPDRIPSKAKQERHVTLQKQRRENEWLQAHQKEREQEWRAAAIQDRLRREKVDKEKELSDLVASSSEQRSFTISGGVETSQASQGNVRNKRFSVDIEQRLENLEKSGDAYLRVMAPLLANMNHTLSEMRKDGMASGITMGLKMSDFVLDMNSEAKRRSVLLDPSPAPHVQGSPLVAHNRHRSGSKSSRGSQKWSSLRTEMNLAKPRSRRNTQGSSRSETVVTSALLEKGGPRRASEPHSSFPDKQAQMIVPHVVLEECIVSAECKSQAAKYDEGNRDPADHQMEAEQAVQRRIEKQEAIFGQLMSGWGADKKK